MHVVRVLVVVMSVAALGFGAGACKKKSSGDSKGKKGESMAAASGKANSDKPKLSAADNPKVGDSCKGLSAADGVMACDGTIKMFCSSYSKYKWKKLGECKDGQKCLLGPKGKSVGCK